MPKLKAFQIKVNDKTLDYRLGAELNLNQVKTFFEKKYIVRKLWSGGRHILGILEKDHKELFLKIATTEGISAVTQNEYRWNEQFNRLIPRKLSNFWVPQNYDCGIYKNKLLYLITEKFAGELLAEKPQKMKISTVFINLIPVIIKFSELIQTLNLVNLPIQEDPNYQKIEKTTVWYNDIPKNIIEKYRVYDLLEIVKSGMPRLLRKPRHGDFTPWHLFKLSSGQLGLIDGEHARGNGVEYYDIGYFIQRIFSELQNPDFAKEILSVLLKSKYDLEKLKVILSARAIGGFLDESIKPKPDYEFSNRFKDWVLRLIS